MSNINRDYLIVLNPKTSKVTVPELNYYIYDKYTANLFVNLVTVENGKVVNMVDADQYKLVLHVLKPTNEIQTVEDIQVFNKEKALFQIELDAELTKNIGRYKCELLTIDRTDHIVQSAKFSYRVKKSIYNDLDVVTETPQYPIIITLLDKLQDIDKYEEERRANEVARVAAEKARVKDYTDLRKTVTTDIDTMQQKIDSFDGKVQEVDNAVTQMRTNITDYQTKKNTELDNYKTQKDTQINTAIKGMEDTIDKYKTEKDNEINDKITQQDTKIDSAIQDQNNTIAANNQAQNKVISDAIAEQNKTINTIVENDKAQDDIIDILKNNQTAGLNAITKLQDKDVAHEERMTAIEAVDVEQNNRLDAIEIKNNQQDGRLNDVEAKNKKQDLDLKCLFAESHSERITLDDEVGNSIFLQNSKQGFATVDELKGNTLVNCNKDTDKELILNGNIDTSGYSTVTTTEGVDGGKVDVALEGNTMVNVCDQEEPVAITKSYEVTTGNHVALQGEYDGKCRPNVYGNTLVNYLSIINKEPYIQGTEFKKNSITEYNNYWEITGQLNEGISDKSMSTNIWDIPLTKSLVPGTYTIIINDCPQTTGFKNYMIRDNTNNIIINSFHVDICTITIKQQCDAIAFYSFSNTMTTSGTEVTVRFPKHIMILEGDYTNKPIPEYFTGLQSSFEDKLITDEKDAHSGKYKVDYKVTGKNKWNGTWNKIANSKQHQSSYIKVNPNSEYILSVSNNYNVGKAEKRFNVNLYNKDKKYINFLVTGYLPNNVKINTSSNCEYIQIINRVNEDFTEEYTNIEECNVQLEEGTTATTYEPYKEYTKTLYLNSPLLEGDTIEQSGNNIIHNHKYNTITFDGSSDEKWTYWESNTELDSSLISFYLPFTDYKDITAISDRFLTGGTVWQEKKEKIALNGDNTKAFQVALLKSRLATQDIAGFIKWLQANPITVAYELATPTKEVISTNDNLLLDSYVNGHLDVDSVVPIDKVAFQQVIIGGLKYLYPSTEYTIQFESDNIGKLHYHMNGGYGDIDVVKGINKFNLTTKDKINWLSLDLSGIGFNASKIVVTPKVDEDFGYFKGMKSVGQNDVDGHKIEILSRNKNLLDNLIPYPITVAENDSKHNDGALLGVVKVKPNTTYIMSVTRDKEAGRVVAKMSNRIILATELPQGLFIQDDIYNFLKSNYANGRGFEKIIYDQDFIKFTTLSDCNYLYVNVDSKYNMDNDVTEVTISNVQIEEVKDTSTTPTTYIPHQENKKEILMNEPLRGLPNGTKDKYVIIDGKWYIERNCMVVQFKDLKYTQINDYQKAEFPDVIGFRLMNTGLIPPIMCDRFAYSNDRIINMGQLLTNKENINICNNGNMDEFFITIQKAKLKTLDFNGIMNYFTENPMEIIAKATTPTYEPIDYNPFEVYAATTHISNNSTIPCNMIIRNSGFNCILKPNTTYTVSSNNGLSSITTKASIGDGILRFYDKDTTSVTKMSNVLVLEGDYITGNPPIPAFFKGMESAFEQELVTDEQDKNYGKYKVNVKATNPDNSQQNNITFYLKEPLRGVGDVKDKVYVKEDKVVVERNCTNYVIEPTQIPIGYSNTKHIYMYNISVNNPIVNTTQGKVVCNNFPCDVNNAHGRNYPNTISTVVDQSVPNGVIRIITDKNSKTLKQWLQANPTTVIYQLATPVYEEVEYFDMKLFVEIFKDTTIIYNSNIPVTSTINYTYSTPLTDAVNTVSDISDEQDSMIIDMATQVATMQMMLM